MKKALILAVVFFIGVALALVLSHGTLNAQSAGSDPEVMSKLNDIVKSQDEVKAALNSIKEELQIIKIRITQMQ